MPLVRPTRREQRDRAVLRMLGADVALSDLTQISVFRILYEEAFIEEWQALWDGLEGAVRSWYIDPRGATGADLDRRLNDFGIERPAARAASGALTVTVEADGVVIPAGAAVETATAGTEPTRYTVLPNPDAADGAWLLDQPGGTVRIAALTPGAAGNTPANTITVLRTGISGVVGVTNAVPLINGRDQAGDDEFRQYFRDYLSALTRGPRDAIIFAIENFVDEDGSRPVHSVALVEWGGQTLLNISGDRAVALAIYIEDGTGGASSALVQSIQRLVDGDDSEGSGLRAAGVPTEVRSAAVLPVDVAVQIDAERTANPFTVQQAVDNAIREYLARLPVGGQLITGELQGQLVFAQLFRRVMNVPGVLRAQFQSPLADVPVPIGRKAMPATVTVAVQSVS